MEKFEARLLAKKRVVELTPREKFVKISQIAEYTNEIINKKGYKSAFVYMSVTGEVNTLTIIEKLFQIGAKVYIPKMIGDDMFMSEIHPDTQYILNRYKIPESPIYGEPDYDVDVNIIPCVAFDKNFNRVGHGKGHYDRYLEKAKGEIIMLAFSEQEVDDVETEGHDIKPNIIVTENGVREK